MLLAENETATTVTGRTTSPFPKVDVTTNRKAANTVKRVHQWLVDNFIEEAKSRNDEFALLVLSSDGKLPPATLDAMYDYLFNE